MAGVFSHARGALVPGFHPKRGLPFIQSLGVMTCHQILVYRSRFRTKLSAIAVGQRAGKPRPDGESSGEGNSPGARVYG
jgi:hypothetical protein